MTEKKTPGRKAAKSDEPKAPKSPAKRGASPAVPAVDGATGGPAKRGASPAVPAVDGATGGPAKSGPRAKKPAAAAPLTGGPEARLQAFIDFPQEGEIVPRGHYTLRIGTVPSAAQVEISIDGGAWTACRAGAGYWWYDWASEQGAHRVEARAQSAEGEISQTDPRHFRVENGADGTAA